MTAPDGQTGRAELTAVRRSARAGLMAAGLFSVFVNLLMLTGPLFMLQVYDRVLGSRSEETLIALVLLMTFLFVMMGVLDHLRGRILARIGAGFQARMDRRVFEASLRRAAQERAPSGVGALRDLEAVRGLLGAPVFAALYDLPWTPAFLAAILVFHPLMGLLALTGGVVLVLLSLLNRWLSEPPRDAAMRAAARAEVMAQDLQGEAEMVRALGMADHAFTRWDGARRDSLAQAVRSGDATGGFGTASRIFRMFLQSAMLALGAWLVLRAELTGGAMIASSILLGRALAPVDATISNWALLQRAHRGWRDLGALLEQMPPEPPRTRLPRPTAHLSAEGMAIVPPGTVTPSLRGISFDLAPGQALGVIGPSGAGKSTLARAVTGVWPPAAGSIRLDGAGLEQFDPSVLGRHMGYLPQRVVLFDGTIAQNIARLAPEPDSRAVIAAARTAAAHDLILSLPEGYDTRVGGGGAGLSGGQIQRIGLARAIYGEPVILVLDEPNANLDADGTAALNAAIRDVKARNGAIIIMAHRPAAIQECDLLLVLEGGQMRAFGPRNEVLAKTVRNARQIRAAASAAQEAP